MTPTMVRRATITWLGSRLVTAAVQVIAVAALSLSVFFGMKVYNLADCQANYAEVSNRSQRARAEAAQVDRVAQDAMFRTVADHPERSLVAIRRYLDSRAAADRQRAANPIPPPPSTKCG